MSFPTRNIIPLLLTNLSIHTHRVQIRQDYSVHSALSRFLSTDEYNVKRAYVLSNEKEVYTKEGITYIPVYYVMFFENISNVIESFI